ncbi:hypothetical protein Scep_024675 [Stephania cephalantha]|uniref:O-methyltransferase n=1 Tax=Stephania cephalantha TaxID=152367 RepID=A0AAP0EX07_9MAGN
MSDRGQGANFLAGLGSLGRLICIPMALKAALDLQVFEIIASAGAGSHLSSSEIASRIQTTNPNAATALDRILRMLAAASLLSVTTRPCHSTSERAYGLTPDTLSLVPNKEGVSAAAILRLVTNEAVVKSFYGLKHAVVEEGCVPFDKLHGENFFKYAAKESRVNQVFNEAMAAGSAIAFEEVFKVYEWFKEVRELVDVGGGWVLHDWGDEYCEKILKNCWKALPGEGGKVIVVEYVLPEELGNNAETFNALIPDLLMMTLSPGGKERTLAQYEDLAMATGFSKTKAFPISQGLHVLEFLKN